MTCEAAATKRAALCVQPGRSGWGGPGLHAMQPGPHVLACWAVVLVGHSDCCVDVGCRPTLPAEMLAEVAW